MAGASRRRISATRRCSSPRARRPEQLALLAAPVPIVLIAAYPDVPHADVIGADNRSGTKAAVRHMFSRTADEAVLHHGPGEVPDARERRRAFEDAVASTRG